MSTRTKCPISEKEVEEQKERLRYLEHLIDLNRKEQSETLEAIKKRNANKVHQ